MTTYQRDYQPLTLNRVIEIQTLTTAPDRFGSPVETWTTLDTVWANARDWKPPAEDFLEDASIDIATRYAIFRIRWRDDFDETARVLWDGVVWNVRGLAEVGRAMFLEIAADSDGTAP